MLSHFIFLISRYSLHISLWCSLFLNSWYFFAHKRWIILHDIFKVLYNLFWKVHISVKNAVFKFFKIYSIFENNALHTWVPVSIVWISSSRFEKMFLNWNMCFSTIKGRFALVLFKLNYYVQKSKLFYNANNNEHLFEGNSWTLIHLKEVQK